MEIFKTAPADFSPQVEVAACYIEIDQKLLLLQRVSKVENGTWGVPAGKLENGETPEDAARRELFEETGISASTLQGLGALYMRKPEVDYVYHMFKVDLAEIPPVSLSVEHSDYLWASHQDLEKLPLMKGAHEALHHFRKKRTPATVNAYLLLKQNDQILLQLRKNTGYCDGMWSLVAGHVEEESATLGMIREAKEELGIEIAPSSLCIRHIMHRKTNRYNVDIFFECSTWQGSIENREPHKCEELKFFPLNALPDNLVDYNLAALNATNFYSEWGWE